MKKIFSFIGVLFFSLYFIPFVTNADDIMYGYAKSMGGTGADSGPSIKVDQNKNVYTTGSFSVTADFNPGTGEDNLVSAGSTDIFVSKLDANGDFLWAKSFGGTGADSGISITTDQESNVYVAGYFAGTNVDFGNSNMYCIL